MYINNYFKTMQILDTKYKSNLQLQIGLNNCLLKIVFTNLEWKV